MSDDTFCLHVDLRRVDVTGQDRLRYLEDVTTQRLEDAVVGERRGALHLDPHGLPQAMFDVVVLGDRLALVVDGELVDEVVNTLGGRTFLLDATFTARDGAAIAVRGPNASAALAQCGLGHLDTKARLVDELLVVPRGDGADVIGTSEALGDVVAALGEQGVRAGDDVDLERWRIRSGIPAWGAEVVKPHLPEEAGVLPTHVHLAKGCYPGQEAVARMWMLGRPRRRLAQVRVDGPCSAGWSTGSGRDQVTVTSVEPEQPSRLALAFVPADAAAGSTFSDDVTTVEVVRLVGDESPPGHDPAVTRRRER